MAAAKARGYPGPTRRRVRCAPNMLVPGAVVLTEHLSYAFEDMASVDFFLGGLPSRRMALIFSLTLIPAARTRLPTPLFHAATTAVNQAGVDGFIIYSGAANDPYLRAARARGLPVVVVISRRILARLLWALMTMPRSVRLPVPCWRPVTGASGCYRSGYFSALMGQWRLWIFLVLICSPARARFRCVDECRRAGLIRRRSR